MVTPTPRKTRVPNILGDWDDVRFFLAVAKTGSFSAAATQLNTKQTTVGRRIQALDDGSTYRRHGGGDVSRGGRRVESRNLAHGITVVAGSGRAFWWDFFTYAVKNPHQNNECQNNGAG